MAKPMMPGGELAKRPLHFIWICDCSGSMKDAGKIQALNTAIKETIPAMKSAVGENPNAELQVRALRFSDSAQWMNKTPISVESYQWYDLEADGSTDMGQALGQVAEELKVPPMSERALPPVLVLISDGQPTDDFDSGLRKLMDQPWGKKAVRIAIAIGDDANLDVLQKFIGNPERKPLMAKNADSLVKLIRWASTAVVKAASAPPSVATGAASGGNVPIPQAPDVNAQNQQNDVW